jgi:type I restriction enzyme S subunit
MENGLEDWITKSINDLCEIGRGRVISQTEIAINIGNYPVFSSQSQNNGEMGRINTYDFDGDFVTWTTDGAYAGTVFFRTGKFNCTNVCGTLSPKNNDDIDLRFLAYKLSTVAKNHVSYVGNPKLMNGVMGKISLQLPFNKKEQSKIAEILSKVDKAISETEIIIAKYNRIKIGLMQDLLFKGIDKDGNIRSEKTHEFKDSPLGRIPKEWRIVSIDEIADLKSGGTPSRQNPSFWDGNISWVKTGEVNYKLINSTEEKITEKGLKHSSTILFPVGTILMALYGQGKTRGRVAILEIEASTNQACLGFLNLKNITTNFLYIVLTNEYSKLRDLSNDGAQKNLSGNLLKKYLLKIPSDIDEQLKIDDLFFKIERSVLDEENKLSKLKSTKTGLMQDLLSGKKRVTHLIN